ncbi:MAG: peptidylprolyl isomerase [candidate division Zixibacteria bacterium]|nr:peptidylprolyl isomerase [candidate division Zixibacteria bacterium]
MKTTMGDIEIEVFEKDCPIHAKNFLKLVENEYYDDLTFHRIAKDFVIQGGDPTGTGGGGPGYRLDMEEKVEVGKKGKKTKQFKYKNKRSYLAMAQSAQGVNGSQFYILVNDAPHLDAKFPCFAKVIKGMDVVDAINKVKTQNSKPVEPVKMLEVKPKPPTPPAEG